MYDKGGVVMSEHLYEKALKGLYACMEACNRCFDACLREENTDMLTDCIRTNRECADMCALMIKTIQSNSRYVSDLANVCSTICQDCAEECLKHSHNHCQHCAEACTHCAKMCRELAS